MSSERLVTLAALMGIESDFLEECVLYEVIDLEDSSEISSGLSPSQSARLRRLQRLCRSLDIDVFAGCIILDLLDRMEELQREIDSPRIRRIG
ncbi:MAG: chaperone modulator CbpM [Elusimicrobiota bacterium]|jgi:hypothetical protein